MKGGTQPSILILMVHLAVAWLCLASSAALLPALASENADAAVLKAEYIKLNFSTASATPETYKTFIASVRAGLVSKAEGSSSGIPVLVDEDDQLALEAFLNITLVNKAGHSVSLKMDIARASFIAYDAGKYSCLLKRAGGTFSSAICYTDPWGSRSPAAVAPPRSRTSTSSRGDLELEAATWRLEDLDEAVSSLYLFPTGNATEEELSRGVAACDMMVASAAAFPYIERRMSAGMWDGNGVADDPSLRGLAVRWPWLSAAVQQSYQGAFAAPVPVQRSDGKWMQVDNVRRAIPLVSFLWNDTCDKSAAAASSSGLPLLIRSVVQEPGGAPATACSQAEPTVRLAGPEGRCVDVPYGYYKNGKQVQLWSCKSTGDVNQLWTLKRDGTIRSNGKCLTSSGDAAGARVVIDECPAAATGRAVWEVRADGTVALKGSPRDLVLAVTSSSLFAGLTVRADDRGTGQSWTPTNDTAPMAAAIVGFRDLCLQVSYAGAVSVAACRDGGVQWSLYPDGSVRPPAWLFLQWQCLAADASGRVTVGYCDGAGSACERWVFRSDGTIFNTGTGKVLDVRACGSKQDCWEVIVSPATAGSPSPTQKWALML